MPPDVICVGSATVDTIAVVDRMPAPDGRVVAEPFVTAGGGPAATAAVTLARLGVAVGFCGVVGDDPAGELSRQLLADAGVDTRWLHTRAGIRTTHSMIVVSRSSGSRMIVTTPSTPPDPQLVPTTESGWLHVDQTGYRSVRAALRAAGGTGVRLSIDGGNPVADLDLTGVELYAPTLAALRAAFPAPTADGSLHAAAAAGARHVVATDGADGCRLLSNGGAGGEVAHVPPAAVEPVSTLGAGDVFHGALLAGLIERRPLAAAAARANVVAALSCRALDGRSGIPDPAETEAFLTTVYR